MVRAGAKTNVIPGVAEFEIDGRTLPGQTDEDLLRELRAVLGPDVELEIIKSAPADGDRADRVAAVRHRSSGRSSRASPTRS